MEWKPVVGFEELYEVSDTGRVRSTKGGIARDKVLQNHLGYHYVGLFRKQRQYRRPVHRLVLEAFVGPAPENYDGGHLDGVRDNNTLSNLAWISRSDNQLHRFAHGTDLRGFDSPSNKLSKRQVAEIKALAPIVGLREVGRRYGISDSHASRIIRGECYPEDRDVRVAEAEAAILSVRVR